MLDIVEGKVKIKIVRYDGDEPINGYCNLLVNEKVPMRETIRRYSQKHLLDNLEELLDSRPETFWCEQNTHLQE